MNVAINGMRDEPFPPEGYHELLDSVRSDPDGAWQTMEGALRLFNTSATVLSLYVWEQHAGLRYLMVEVEATATQTIVYYYHWSDAALVEVTRRPRSVTNPVGATFLAVGRWLWILGPDAPPVRWDGSRVERVGLAVAPSPVVSGPSSGFDAFDAAGGLLWYDPWRLNPPTEALSYGGSVTTQRGVGQRPEAYDVTATPVERPVGRPFQFAYGVTWITETGAESPLSPVTLVAGSNEPGIDEGRRALEVRIPPGPPGSVGGRLWRSVDAGNQTEPIGLPMWLVDVFGHAAGHTFVDVVPDQELTVLLDRSSVGSPPLSSPAGAMWAGYVWLVDGADPQRLVRSAPGAPEQFPSDSYFTVATPGRIVALVPHQRTMVVLTTRGVFAFPDPDSAPVLLSASHGTTAGGAATSVPDGVVFLDDHLGPCLVRGSLQDEQNTAIDTIPGCRRTWRKYALPGRLEAARVLYDPEYQEVWWSFPVGGNVQNGIGLVYHLAREGWSLRKDWPVDAMVRTPSGVLVATSTAGTPGVDLLTYGEGARVSGGNAVGFTLYSGWIETTEAVMYRSVELFVEDRGTQKVYADLRYDRRPEDLDQTERGKDLVHADHNRDLWGDALWSATEEWVEAEPARVVIPFYGRSFAYSFQVRLAGRRIRLWSMNVQQNDERAPPFSRERPGEVFP